MRISTLISKIETKAPHFQGSITNHELWQPKKPSGSGDETLINFTFFELHMVIMKHLPPVNRTRTPFETYKGNKEELGWS